MLADRIDGVLSFGSATDATSITNFWLSPSREAHWLTLPDGSTHADKYSMLRFHTASALEVNTRDLEP